MSSFPQFIKCLASFFRRGIFLCLLAFFTSSAYADSIRVTLIPSRDTTSYQQVITTINQQLLAHSPNNIVIKVVSLNDFKQHSRDIDQSSELLVPIGILATDSVIKHTGTAPILATLVPRISFNTSLKQAAQENATKQQRPIGVVLLDQPIERQLILAQLLFGNSQRIGIPLGPASQTLRHKIDRAINTLDLPVEIETIDNSEMLMPRLSALLNRSDVLLALPDPTLFNRRTVRNILLSTYRKRIPVIGFSHAYVKAGALAAAYSTPQQIGRQTVEIILSLQHESSQNFVGPSQPKYFSIAINAQVSRSLGVRKIAAKELEQQIIRIERGHK